MNFEILEKLKQLPRHGVLPGRFGGAGAARGGRNIPPVSPIQAAPVQQELPREVAPATPPVSSINEQVEQLARQRANEIVAEQAQMRGVARLGRTFTTFDVLNDVVSKQKETVTAGLWSDGIANLTTFF